MRPFFVLVLVLAEMGTPSHLLGLRIKFGGAGQFSSGKVSDRSC